jgi:hypothetical protein
VSFTADARAEVSLFVNGDSVVPREVKSLLTSGKLSSKKMPQGQSTELYQDYVCGAVFRIARELFALLPLEAVVVTAFGHLLDSSSGHMTDQPILSIVIPRRTAETLNFDALDPSDALQRFVHNMSFRKTKGFSAVEALSVDSVTL